jgi:hypothetical protein
MGRDAVGSASVIGELSGSAIVDASEILSQARALETLGAVLRWSLARTPQAEFVDVVVQDEFTHDVVVRVADGLYLVFGTT